MKRRNWVPCAVAFIAASATACLTIDTLSEDHATLVKTQPVTGRGYDRKLHASVDQLDDAFTITLTSDETCEVHVERVLHRTRTLRRKVDDKTTLLFEYGLGAALLIAGGIVTYDAPNVPMDNDPVTSNPIGRTGAYGIGGGLLALGTASVVEGIVNSRRARDSTEYLGQVSEPTNDPRRDVSCNERPASN